MLHKNLKKEEIQKFIKKHRLTECFEVDGQFFRVKANAESHCRWKKIDPSAIVTHPKEVADEKAKAEKAKAGKEVQN